LAERGLIRRCASHPSGGFAVPPAHTGGRTPAGLLIPPQPLVGHFDQAPIRLERCPTKKPPGGGFFVYLAERGGFEPPRRYKRLPDFESGTFNRSATSPDGPGEPGRK